VEGLAVAVDGALEPHLRPALSASGGAPEAPPVRAALEARLGHAFADPALLDLALTHASAADVGDVARDSYQRLEFLGDRVLGLAVATMLLEAFPSADEGELARRLNHLVRRETCAEVAIELGLDRAIRIGAGEAQAGGRRKTAILGDVCESVLAAVYLDGGLAAAAALVDRYWRPRMLGFLAARRDAKTTLQEWAQGRSLSAPVYQAVGRIGPDHAPRFTIVVRVDGLDPAEGLGRSKREAEQGAATALLVREGIWPPTEAPE
jgi:ribonuclease-3